MNLNYILRKYKHHQRYKKVIAETYIDVLLWQQAVSETRLFRLLPERRQRVITAHFIHERRAVNRENFIVFLLLEILMAVTAFLTAFNNADPRLSAWMITSFIFSVGMFIAYKALTGMVGWVKTRA